VIYRQFSVTIVSAMALSVGVALILSPALCATLLQPGDHDPLHRRGLFGGFNRWFDLQTRRYVAGVNAVIARRTLHLAIYGAVAVGTGLLFARLPTGFFPVEDQGQMMVQFTLPSGATVERTEKARLAIERYFEQNDARNVPVLFANSGFSFAGSGQNAGIEFTTLAPFDERRGAQNTVDAIVARANKALASVRDAHIVALAPPTIHGLGQSTGFTFELLNTSGMPRDQFAALRDTLVDAASKDPKLSRVRAAILPDTQQLRVDFDDAKLAVLGLTESDVTGTLSSAWGGAYIGDFVDRGRVKRVYMQADAPFRMLPEDLDKWFVRSAGAASGGTSSMTPFSSFATSSWEMSPNRVSRFNGRSAYEIDGDPAPGRSSGEAMKEMVALQQKLAPGTGYAWSALSYQESQSSGQALYLYMISILVVFLCLAALYESWSVPFAVILVIPLGIVGAVLAVTFRGLENNIYFQVGLLTTIGLACKNAILIVEFAEIARRKGMGLVDAALQAARVRLRPILMTSIAFIAGVLPLALAWGAGAQSRIAIGTAVLGGMLTATALAIFYVPMFFILVARLFHRSGQA
jgi:multidrug efflux pump